MKKKKTLLQTGSTGLLSITPNLPTPTYSTPGLSYTKILQSLALFSLTPDEPTQKATARSKATR